MSLLKALPAAALLFLPSSAATVHSLSVVPSSGKTEVVIGVNAAVEVQDFTLDAPARVVVDLNGATLDMSHRGYDKVSRGGIINIRYSQYRPNIVRVVIELDAKHPYEVTRTNDEVRVSVTGGRTAEYTTWSSTPGRRPTYVAAPAPPARQISAAPENKSAVHTTPAPVKTVAARPVARAAQAVAQVETSTAQADTQDDPAPPAAEITAPRASSTYSKPVA